jgi:hypothetical protein
MSDEYLLIIARAFYRGSMVFLKEGLAAMIRLLEERQEKTLERGGDGRGKKQAVPTRSTTRSTKQ